MLNIVVLDQELFLALHHKNSFPALRMLDIVVHDSRLARLFPSKCDVRFNIVLDLIGDDLGAGAFDD